MAIQAEIHKLPQDMRKQVQKMRDLTVGAQALSQVGCLTRILVEVSEKLMQLEVSHSDPAFICLRDLDQTATVLTQHTMTQMDDIIDELSRNPDGSRFPMSDTQKNKIFYCCFSTFYPFLSYKHSPLQKELACFFLSLYEVCSCDTIFTEDRCFRIFSRFLYII